MNKKKFFTAIITIGISVAVLLFIINIIFKDAGINQGNFRISDTILTSVVELEDKSENGEEWKYDISQNNKISMLVQTNKNSEIKEVYLEKVKVKSKNNVNIYLEQEQYELSYEYKKIRNKKVNVYAEEREDGNYLIEFDVKNKDVVSDFNIPEGTKELRHDGTILNLANIAISDITYELKYNLVIVESIGQTNTCKINIKMPDLKVATEGLAVERLDSSNFKFKVDY